MYPSNDDYYHINDPNPISLPEQILPLFISETTNPNSKLEEELQYLTSSSFHFPSPYNIHYEDFVNELTWQQLHDLFIHQQQQVPFTADQTIVNNIEDPKHIDDHDHAVEKVVLKQGVMLPADHDDQQKNTRKRSLKKDRHSKITTAKGPRDRRMRLSLDVARKFFDLQDVLGFDKASKTVEWLLIQSNSAIKEVTCGSGVPPQPAKYERGSGSGSCVGGAITSVSSTTSECEVVSSGIDDATTATNDITGQQLASHICSRKTKLKSACKKEKKAKVVARRRTALMHLLARESRKAARERARKRTREKSKLGETKWCLEEEARKRSSGDLKQYLGSCRGQSGAAVEDEDQSGGTHGSSSSTTKINIIPCTLEGLKEVEHQFNSTQEQREYDIPVITANWNPSSICTTTYQQEAEIISHHVNQFSDFEYCGGKTWEAYNNMSLGA